MVYLRHTLLKPLHQGCKLLHPAFQLDNTLSPQLSELQLTHSQCWTSRSRSTCCISHASQAAPQTQVTAVLHQVKQNLKEEPKLAKKGAAQTDNPIDTVFVSSEVAPWSKTGGLGDVVGSLPIALASRGHRVMVVAPR